MILVRRHDVKAPLLEERKLFKMMTSLEDPNKFESCCDELAQKMLTVYVIVIFEHSGDLIPDT